MQDFKPPTPQIRTSWESEGVPLDYSLLMVKEYELTNYLKIQWNPLKLKPRCKMHFSTLQSFRRQLAKPCQEHVTYIEHNLLLKGSEIESIVRTMVRCIRYVFDYDNRYSHLHNLYNVVPGRFGQIVVKKWIYSQGSILTMVYSTIISLFPSKNEVCL